jgi:hypothetical protein
MRSESAKARLSDDVVPVHRDVYPHCLEESAILRAVTLTWCTYHSREAGNSGLRRR